MGVGGRESTVKWRGREKKKDRLFGKTAERRGKGGERRGDVRDKRRKRRSAENTGISREMEGKILSVSVMIKRFMGVEREGG